MTSSTPAFASVTAEVTRLTGLDFPPSRVALAEIAIRRVMARDGENDLTRFVERLRIDPAVLQSLLGEVTIRETYFFRDRPQFEALRTTVIPDILGRAGGPMRVWSAGCASGEEVYSLALLLNDFGQCGRARIVGTDISAEAVGAARRGFYSTRSFREGIDPAAGPGFVAAGRGWMVRPRFRAAVAFGVHNLLDARACPQLGDDAFDLIVCRNVFIYLSPHAAARGFAALIARLAPGGWLVISSTDPLPPKSAELEVVVTPAGLLYRRPASPRPDPAVLWSPPRVVSRPVTARAQRTPSRLRLSAPPSAGTAADRELDTALRLLDEGREAEALIAARRARYLDRSCPVAHLVYGRALRTAGRREAAGRSLLRSIQLLQARGTEETVARAHGLTVGALGAIVDAELRLAAREVSA